MKLAFIITLLSLLTTLNAAESLQMEEVGGTKIATSSCVNTTCTVTLSAGSQLFFQIQNITNKNLVITKFEITKTYNGQEVTQTSSTDSALLGGASFNPSESVNLGYNLVNNELANYWTGKYYLLDIDTGEKFINSLNWNNDLTAYSVVATDITENKIDVSNVTELRAALTTAASDGKDTIIYLADGNYTTTEDGLGQFQYSTSQNYTLTIKGSNRDNVILSGENISRVLFLYGGKEFHLENVTIENGYVDGEGAGIQSNTNLYCDKIVVKNNHTSKDGGGISADNSSKANLWLNNSVIENNSGYFGGGFKTWNADVRNSIIRGNTAKHSAGGFYAAYAQVYNSIITSNTSQASAYNGGAFHSHSSLSIVNSLIANNNSGVTIYSGDSNYIVNTVFSNNGLFDVKSSGSSSVNIDYSYFNGSMSIPYFGSNNISSGELGFVDENNSNYRLTSLSALLDMGTIENNAVDIPLLDMDGYKRVAGASIDIGPYELSSSRPTLYAFSHSGDAKEFSELTFEILYNFEDGRNLDNIAYDYTNDGSWTSSNTHTFNTAGTYIVNVKVTDSEGEFSTKSLAVTITELPFSDMTDEQKLIKAIDPAYYNDIIAIIDAEKSASNASGVTTGENNVVLDPNSHGLHTQSELDTAISDTNTSAYVTGKQYVQNNPSEFNLVTTADRDTALADMNNTATASGIATGKQYVQNNLLEFGLVPKSDVQLTASTISGLSAGWTLVSTPFAITDLSVFDSATVVWVYNNSTSSWSAYSSDTTMKQKIIDNVNVTPLTTIPAGSGIWVQK